MLRKMNAFDAQPPRGLFVRVTFVTGIVTSTNVFPRRSVGSREFVHFKCHKMASAAF